MMPLHRYGTAGGPNRVKLDLHVHCCEYSACGQASMPEMIEAGIEQGLDGLVFTNHDCFVDPARIARLNADWAPFRIYNGIEVSADDHHFLVYGIYDKALESQAWSWPALHAFVRERGGFVCLAHAFRWHTELAIDADGYPPDAIELASVNIDAMTAVLNEKLMERLGVGGLTNSDAHATRYIALHANAFDRLPDDEADLARLLHAGAFAHETIEIPLVLW